VEENLAYGKNSTVNVENIRKLRPRYAWTKPFVFFLTVDRGSTERCFLYACYGNPEYSYAGHSTAIKQQIVDMAMNASGIRDTARVLHVSPTTVIKELKKLGWQTERE